MTSDETGVTLTTLVDHQSTGWWLKFDLDGIDELIRVLDKHRRLLAATTEEIHG